MLFRSCPVKKYNIGLFGGTTIGRVVLCNAITGETKDYAVEDVPQWVDRVYSADLLVELYNYHGTLKHGFFNSVLGQKDCTSEPIRSPHLAGTSQEVQIMKLANYNQLEKFLIDNISDFHFGLLLCMHTGIRVGELSGLRWEDVDFAQHKIRIQRTVIRIKNLDQTANPDTGKIPKTILYIGPPKTEHSNREIPLPDKLLFYAKRFRKDGSAYILSGTARCMEPRVIQRRYAALLKTCGIPPIKIHALRHQFSCRWVEHGFDTKSLSEILGHTSVRTTLDLYVHIQAETKRQYMNQMMEQAI